MKKLLMVIMFGVLSMSAHAADSLGHIHEASDVLSIDPGATYSSLKVTSLGPCKATILEVVASYADGSSEVHEMESLALGKGESVEIPLNAEKETCAIEVRYQGCSKLCIEGVLASQEPPIEG